MQIAGLQKLTLLDYPGQVACTVFLSGCNFRCPFCHNSGLLGHTEPLMTHQELLSFLDSRKGLLDAVCVSGGEPTLTGELPQLLKAIKEKGFLVKLDTNGSRPEVLKALVEQGLVDYVAMDVKNGPAQYGATTGVDVDIHRIEQSLRFLLEGKAPYELRTTVVAQLHSEESLLGMGKWLQGLVPGKKPEKLFLQTFVDRESVLQEGLSAPEGEQMHRYLQLLAPFVEQIELRGVT